MNPRAWAAVYAFCAALGLALLVALLPRPGEPETLAVCRALVPNPAAPLHCLDGLAPDIVAAELAGSARRWRCIVHRGEVPQPSPHQRDCAEQRTERLRGEVRGFDQGVFMPLYTALSLLLSAWAWSHGRLRAAPAPTHMRTLSLALLGTTVAVVALDLWENQRLLLMLDGLDREGVALLTQAVVPGLGDSLDAAARAARRASAWKWLSCAPWALCLGLVMWGVLRWDPALAAPRPWRWLSRIAALAAVLAGALMAVGGAAGLVSDGLVVPVQTLTLGSIALVIALASAAAAAAWGAIKRGIPFDATAPALVPGSPPR